MVETLCKEESKKLNCGCCEEVVLGCTLTDGHSDKHRFEVEDYDGVKFTVWWEKS